MGEAHEGIATRHQGTKSTARKILLAGLWWPTLFEDVDELVKAYDVYQRVGKLGKHHLMPLYPILAHAPFEK